MKPAKNPGGTLNALAISTPNKGLNTYCEAYPIDNGTGLDVEKHKETNISASSSGGQEFFLPSVFFKGTS
jgi:hypothetical protein